MEKGADGPPVPNYPIESVDNALRLLLLIEERRQLRVSEAAEILGVAGSTAHRLLAMLQYHGFIRQDGRTRSYTAGPVLTRIGLSVVRDMDLRTFVRPYLEELAAEVNETVHVAMLQNEMVLFIDSVESSRALRVASRVGTTMPSHCTSVGKVLLAALSDERLRQLYPSTHLPPLTSKSLTSRAVLMRELEVVRKRGYAASSGESEEGVGSVGVAIRDRTGHAIAAISAAAPLPRLGKERLKEIGDACLAVADRIGKDLP